MDPSLTAPYSILVCLAKSSAESMGESILSTVRKAARLAVYEEIMINVKNHQIPPTILVERALGINSDPVTTVAIRKYQLCGLKAAGQSNTEPPTHRDKERTAYVKHDGTDSTEHNQVSNSK